MTPNFPPTEPTPLDRQRWLREAAYWDGAFPCLAAFCAVLVRIGFPKGHIAEVVAEVLVPIGLSLIRAHLAGRTLTRLFPKGPPVARQLALAVAIIVLLFMEMTLALKVFAPDAPLLAIILMGWIVYLGLMSAATHPPHSFGEPTPPARLQSEWSNLSVNTPTRFDEENASKERCRLRIKRRRNKRGLELLADRCGCFFTWSLTPRIIGVDVLERKKRSSAAPLRRYRKRWNEATPAPCGLLGAPRTSRQQSPKAPWDQARPHRQSVRRLPGRHRDLLTASGLDWRDRRLTVERI